MKPLTRTIIVNGPFFAALHGQWCQIGLTSCPSLRSLLFSFSYAGEIDLPSLEDAGSSAGNGPSPVCEHDVHLLSAALWRASEAVIEILSAGNFPLLERVTFHFPRLFNAHSGVADQSWHRIDEALGRIKTLTAVVVDLEANSVRIGRQHFEEQLAMARRRGLLAFREHRVSICIKIIRRDVPDLS